MPLEPPVLGLGLLPPVCGSGHGPVGGSHSRAALPGPLLPVVVSFQWSLLAAGTASSTSLVVLCKWCWDESFPVDLQWLNASGSGCHPPHPAQGTELCPALGAAEIPQLSSTEGKGFCGLNGSDRICSFLPLSHHSGFLLPGIFMTQTSSHSSGSPGTCPAVMRLQAAAGACSGAVSPSPEQWVLGWWLGHSSLRGPGD